MNPGKTVTIVIENRDNAEEKIGYDAKFKKVLKKYGGSCFTTKIGNIVSSYFPDDIPRKRKLSPVFKYKMEIHD